MRPVHFEIHAENIERASNFYKKVFGWEMKGWPLPDGSTYTVITTGDKNSVGINGGFVPRRGSAPEEGAATNAYVCTMETKNLLETIEKVKNNGGKIALDPMDVPGVGKLAYCKDTEGNIFGILEPLPGSQA